MDSKTLRDALAKFATCITVITTADKRENPYGVTVNSITSVSLEPPLVLWCLGDQTYALDTFLNAEHFVINVLSSEQQNISTNFAVPGEFDRFANVSYRLSPTNVPILDNCLASFECSCNKINREGDHWIFIARIESFIKNTGDPLIYFDSQYSSLSDRE